MRRIGNPLTRPPSFGKFTRLVRILDQQIPTDAPTGIIPITSLRGFRGYKVQGLTEGRQWSVELYGGNFYLVWVQGYEAKPLNLPLHVVNHLRAHLHLTGTSDVRVHHPAP